MRKVFIGVLVALAAIAFLAVLGWVLGHACGGPGVPRRTILELDLERPLPERRAEGVLEIFDHDEPTLRDVVEALERAREDPRVVSLIARVGAASMGIAQVEELREAVLRFREKGKRAVAFAETFGEFGPGNGAYYLATAFDEIYLQPTGSVGLTGFSGEQYFLAGTLEKIGVRLQGDRRYEYKNAYDVFTQKHYTPAHREAVTGLLRSVLDRMVQGIVAGRKIPEAEVRALLDRGPLLAKEALTARLLDGLKYRDEVYDEVKARAGKNAELLYAEKYLARAGRPYRKGPTIALIYGVGEIRRGRSQYDPLIGEHVFGAETVAQAFRAAVKDKDVRAILFRVNSPGGSAVASDVVWREVTRARARGKPVIVSMGDVAASGGYYVAAGATTIVAHPGTVTGSIGVFAAKPLTQEMWHKLGVTWDDAPTNANSRMWSGLHEYTPHGWQRLQATLDAIYDDFTSKVADGRKLPKERVLEIAKGRIWTGAQAKDLGLVDELGGFSRAVALCKKAAGLKESDKVRLVPYPRPRSLLETLLDEGPENSETPEGGEVAVLSLAEARALASMLRQLGLVSAGGPLFLRVGAVLGLER